MGNHIINGSDNVSITVTISGSDILIAYRPAGPCENAQNIFVALRTHRQIGAAVLPFAQNAEGSTVFLPFKADLLLSGQIRDGAIAAFLRRWERWRWSERELTQAFAVIMQDSEIVFRIPRSLVGDATTIDFAAYAKDPNANAGWGWFWGCSDPTVEGGVGDKFMGFCGGARGGAIEA